MRHLSAFPMTSQINNFTSLAGWLPLVSGVTSVWSRRGLAALRPSTGPTRRVRWLVGWFHTGATLMAPVAFMSTIDWSCRIPPRVSWMTDRLLWWTHVKAKYWKDTASRWCTVIPLFSFSYSSSLFHFFHTLWQITKLASQIRFIVYNIDLWP